MENSSISENNNLKTIDQYQMTLTTAVGPGESPECQVSAGGTRGEPRVSGVRQCSLTPDNPLKIFCRVMRETSIIATH